MQFCRLNMEPIFMRKDWGVDHTGHFWHHQSASPAVIVWKSGEPTSTSQHNFQQFPRLELDGKFGVIGAWDSCAIGRWRCGASLWSVLNCNTEIWCHLKWHHRLELLCWDLLGMNRPCNIIKQCAFVHVGLENIIKGCPTSCRCRLQFECLRTRLCIFSRPTWMNAHCIIMLCFNLEGL